MNSVIYIAVCIVKEQPNHLLRYGPSENFTQVWSKLQSKVKNIMKLLHDVDFVFACNGMDIAIKQQDDLVNVIHFARDKSISPIPLRVLSTCGETSASAAVSSVSKRPPSLSPSTSTGVPTKKRRFSVSMPNASGIASELEQAFQHASYLQSQIEEHRLARLRINGHLSLDGLGTQFAEGRLHIDVVFRTRFEEEHVAVLLAEFARFNRGNFPRVL